MKYLQAYITYWGQIAVITPSQRLGRFTDCPPGYPVTNCNYSAVME